MPTPTAIQRSDERVGGSSRYVWTRYDVQLDILSGIPHARRLPGREEVIIGHLEVMEYHALQLDFPEG